MGWTDYHLNQFTIYKKSYTIPNVIGNISGGGSWGKNVKLNELKLKINKKFIFFPEMLIKNLLNYLLMFVEVRKNKKLI